MIAVKLGPSNDANGKKPVKKAEDALAFGDAAMEATTTQKAIPKAKTAQ